MPGPQVPLYVLGRELQDLFPVAFLPEDHALAVAIMSYNGSMDFGLLADYDAMPDLDGLADGIDAAREELVAAAKRKQRRASASAKRAKQRTEPVVADGTRSAATTPRTTSRTRAATAAALPPDHPEPDVGLRRAPLAVPGPVDGDDQSL